MKGDHPLLWWVDAKKRRSVFLVKECTYFLKSIPLAVKGRPRYSYSWTCGKGWLLIESVREEVVSLVITPDLLTLMLIPLCTLQVVVIASMRWAMLIVEGWSLMSSAKRSKGGMLGLGSIRAILVARSSM